MVSELQKRTAQAIVNLFETGQVLGDYGSVTLLAGDTGHLTYGRSQTTLASGNLYLLIKGYCEASGAAKGDALSAYLERLEGIDLDLDRDMGFRGLLREAGDDRAMHRVQDAFFDRVYWQPAIKSCDYIGVVTALGTSVVYDSRIHGSWHRRRDATTREHGALSDIGEQDWIGRYVEVRRAWLTGHSNALLGRTVYRMDAFRTLMDDGAWDLALPLRVRGVRIDEAALDAEPPLRVSAEDPDVRLLRLRRPFMEGDDVRELQQALASAGIAVGTDGVFGPATETAIKAFQEREDMAADGIVGPATRAALAAEA